MKSEKKPSGDVDAKWIEDMKKYNTIELMSNPENLLIKRIYRNPDFMNFVIWITKKYAVFVVPNITSNDAEKEIHLESWTADRYCRDLLKAGLIRNESRGMKFFYPVKDENGKLLLEKLAKIALNVKKNLESTEAEKNG